MTISDITGDFCPPCGEFILKKDESARVSAMMLEFNKQINASIVDPQFITLSLVQLLRVLDRRPDLLDEIAATKSTAQKNPNLLRIR